MSCKKTISNLNAYADGELSARRHRLTKVHLDNCAACRNRLGEIKGLDVILDAILPVPPVPSGLAARVMAAAAAERRQAGAGRRFLSRWNPLLWLGEFSAAMRLAVCAAALLAFVCGLSLNSGQNKVSRGGNDLYGLEWFGANPPGSIGSAYIAMNVQGQRE